MKTITIFGVFDGIHEGHLMFIHDAKREGDRLVAIVARDSEVKKLKDKSPEYSEAMRIKALIEVPEIDLVLLGDLEQGTYKVLKEVKPDIIYLGYDQQALSDNIYKAIKKKILPKIELKFGKSHKAEKFKSSIINKSNELRK